MSKKDIGLYEKFTVTRNDGSEKHQNCEYFVLDLTHDVFAATAIKAYAEACRYDYPALANDLLSKAKKSRENLPKYSIWAHERAKKSN